MEEEKFSEEESLQLIQSMINHMQDRFGENGHLLPPMGLGSFHLQFVSIHYAKSIAYQPQRHLVCMDTGLGHTGLPDHAT